MRRACEFFFVSIVDSARRLKFVFILCLLLSQTALAQDSPESLFKSLQESVKIHRWDLVEENSSTKFFDRLTDGMLMSAFYLEATHKDLEKREKITKLIERFGLGEMLKDRDQRLMKGTLARDVKAKLGMVKYSFLSEFSKTVELKEILGFAGLFSRELNNLDASKKLALAELKSSTANNFIGVSFDKVDGKWKFDGPLDNRFVYKLLHGDARTDKFWSWRLEIVLRERPKRK